jgi:hypothetical protein
MGDEGREKGWGSYIKSVGVERLVSEGGRVEAV